MVFRSWGWVGGWGRTAFPPGRACAEQDQGLWGQVLFLLLPPPHPRRGKGGVGSLKKEKGAREVYKPKEELLICNILSRDVIWFGKVF